MKLFQQREVREAIAHAESGGQALHLHWSVGGDNAPACFKKHRQWGHLIDHDLKRLKATARRLGVRKIAIDRLGARGQHVDLCGKPLERAIAKASAA